MPTPGQEQIAGQRIVFYFAPVNTAKWVYARQSKQPRVTILIQMNVCSSAYFSFFLSLRRAKDYILPVATNFHPFLLLFFFSSLLYTLSLKIDFIDQLFLNLRLRKSIDSDFFLQFIFINQQLEIAGICEHSGFHSCLIEEYTCLDEKKMTRYFPVLLKRG